MFMQNDNSESESPTPEEQMAIWLEAIKNNAAIKEYLSQFHPQSVEGFIDDYVKAKNNWYTYGPNYVEESENKSIRWITAAALHLPVILQKKLFDAQCLWRAEQLEIDELKLCCEFQVWENNILNCPFIEPLTEDDIALYQSFLLKCPLDVDLYIYEEWQNMDDLRERFRDEHDSGNFPEWYEFSNVYKGTGTLMLLPDIRGQKEEFYMQLSRVERQEKNREQDAEYERSVDHRPSLSIYKAEDLTAFVSRFEDSDCKRLFNSYRYFHNRMNFKDDIELELELLSEAEEMVPMQAHSDWRTAIQNTARSYERKKIAEALPQAWEEYRINIDLGIGFPIADHSDQSWLVDLYKEMILRGRVLNGEPEDLMF
jgi:hypothetical protein